MITNIVHLGPRVTALVDGQMSAAEEERAWSHVYACASCRAAVEREGWAKRQVVSLSLADQAVAPAALKGALFEPALGAWAAYPTEPVDQASTGRSRRASGLAVIGASSVGAAMVGVLAFSAAPAQAPVPDRRLPVTNLLTPTRASTPERGGQTGTGHLTHQQRSSQLQGGVTARAVSTWRMGL